MCPWARSIFCVLLVILCAISSSARRSPYEVLQPDSIEYKYIVRNILPRENRWWRRGTHHDIDPKSPVVIVRP